MDNPAGDPSTLPRAASAAGAASRSRLQFAHALLNDLAGQSGNAQDRPDAIASNALRAEQFWQVISLNSVEQMRRLNCRSGNRQSVFG